MTIPDKIWKAVETWGEAGDIPEDWCMEIDCLEDDHPDLFRDAVMEDDELALELMPRIAEEAFRFAVTLQLVLDTASVPCHLEGDVSDFYAFAKVSREFGFQDVIAWDKAEEAMTLIECKQASSPPPKGFGQVG